MPAKQIKDLTAAGAASLTDKFAVDQADDTTKYVTGSELKTLINTSANLTGTWQVDGVTITATGAELNYVDGVTSAIQTQLDGKATSAQGALADTALQPADIGSSVQAHSAVLDATTASFLLADETKLDYLTVTGAANIDTIKTKTDYLTVTGAVDLDTINTKVGYISVTQAVDLDQMETDIAALSNGVVLAGTWDASTGSFPGGGAAQSGYTYIVSAGGTVDGEEFTANDRILAIADNASTTTYASNWHKLDYTDAVSSVAGKTGAVTLEATDIASGTFADARIAESNVTQHVAAIDHDSLLNFSANEHIDWTNASSALLTSANITSNGSIIASSSAPVMAWNETDAGTDEKIWRAIANTDSWRLQTLNDSWGWVANAISVERTGSAVSKIQLDATEVELNATTIDINGDVDISGTLTTTTKQTIYVPAAAMVAATTNGAESADLETTTNAVNYKVLDFDATTDEYAHFNVAMPKSWDEGTITFQPLWSTTATDADGVAWGLQAVACGDSDAADAAFGTAVVVTDDNQSAAGDVLITAESSAVTVGGTPGESDLVFFRIFRDVSDANDDMTEDARLVGVRIFINTTQYGDD